jgi:8-oxo-dGTP pyrophosphatase MutT (NUDIX family)
MSDDLVWRRLESEPGPDLMLFQVRYDTMQHPDSGDQLRRLVIESVDWVNMVAVTTNRELVMVRQYRFGVGYPTLETAGGMVDEGETSLQAAQRELLEETGYGGGNWQYLGAVEPNPAFHDHLCHHWLATDVELLAAPTPGRGEHIAVELMSPAEMTEAVQSGELKHVLALSALSRVYELWPRPFISPNAGPSAG